MPANPPAANPVATAAGLGNYLKKNAKFAYGGAIGGLFLASDVKGIFDADNKLKALLKTFKDFVLLRVAMVGVFTAVGAAMRSLVRETGSLDAALKRLAQMQTFSRQFATFTGGLQAARQRVAQLLQLSERGPFKFEEIVEANRNLEVFTKGAQSSIAATQEIGKAAIATGNNIEDVAKVVGTFYDNLQNGQPVNQTTEQMRQMGLVSTSTANKLNAMADGGQDVVNTMGELNAALATTAQGAKGFQNELATVTAEHEKAAEGLKAAFGAPWTEKDIQNTKNYTAAIRSITPALASVSKSFATLYNGFTTFTSTVIRAIAGTSAAGTAVKGLAAAINGLAVAAALFGTYAAATLIPVILRFGGALSAMPPILAGVTIAFRALAATTVIGLVATAVGTLVAAMINLKSKTSALKEEYKTWQQSHEDATKAILAEAAAITTLAEKQGVLEKAHQRILDLNKEDLEASKRRMEIYKQLKDLTDPTKAAYYTETPGTEKALRKEDQILEKKQKRIRADKQAVSSAASAATATDVSGRQIVEAEAAAQIAREQGAKGAKQRADEAMAGLQERRRVENAAAQATNKLAGQQKDLEDRRASAAASGRTGADYQIRKAEQFAAKELEITDTMKQQRSYALGADPKSAVFLEAKAQQLREAKTLEEKEAQLRRMKPGTPEEIEMRAQVDRARQLSGGIKFNADELHRYEVEAAVAKQKEARAGQYEEEKRSARIQQFQIETEIKGHQARRRGDIAGAQAQEDMANFVQNFEQLRPALGEQTAASVALAKTSDDIAQQYQDSQRIVSSMTAIGGGGGVSGVNPQLESDKRREALQQEMVRLLNILSGQETPTGAQTGTFAP